MPLPVEIVSTEGAVRQVVWPLAEGKTTREGVDGRGATWDLWGRGLGSEAGGGALHYAWDTLGLERVTAVAFPENLPSIRIMEKLGLAFERRATGRELGLAAPEIEVVVYAIER